LANDKAIGNWQLAIGNVNDDDNVNVNVNDNDNVNDMKRRTAFVFAAVAVMPLPIASRRSMLYRIAYRPTRVGAKYFGTGASDDVHYRSIA